MASNLGPVPPIPPVQQPLINPAGGTIDKDWYLFLKSLYEHVREIETRLDDHDARITDLETP